MSNLIFCKFLDDNGNTRGRDYTYISDIPVSEGDYVLVEVARSSSNIQQKKVLVTKINVNPDTIPGYDKFRGSIKKIIGKAPAETDGNAEKDKTVTLSFEEL